MLSSQDAVRLVGWLAKSSPYRVLKNIFVGRHAMKRAKNYLIIAGVTVLILLVAGFILAGIFSLLLDVLYIALILLAAFSLISTALLITALLMLINTIITVRNEMKPLIESVQETVSDVKGSVEETLGAVKDTAKSAGHAASTIGATAKLASIGVAPGVRAAALVVAGQQMVRVFIGKGHTRNRYEERRKQQMELMDASVGGE
jgi:ABC-type multidrug transport system fused ATPase/permease subunit